MLGVLRDEQPLFTPQPTDGDLGELVHGFRAAGLPVRLTRAGDPLPEHAGLRLAIYRIVQESLTNALRHAPGAGCVEVRIAHHGDTVHITVVDDGGSHVDPHISSGGRGVIGMRERAAVYGGTVEAGPYRTGWRVRATLDVPEEDS
jgi:signal transduction histidine kinase